PVSARNKELMFRPALDNYGYGFVITDATVGEGRKIKMIAHGGGIHGFNTLLQRFPEDRHLIVLLNNTGGTKLQQMAQKIRDILCGLPASPPLEPVLRPVVRTLLDKGVAAALAEYRSLRKDQQRYESSPGDLAFVGRELVARGRKADAIEV